MAAAQAAGPGLSGVLRMTWVRDGLAHVLGHADIDEPSGTWTGLACGDHGLDMGTDVDTVTLLAMCGDGKLADLIWDAPDELAAVHRSAFDATMPAYNAGNTQLADQRWKNLQEIWSQAWAAKYAALEVLQQAGIAKFGKARPQRWVVASFEHHCGPHGIAKPHVHNVVITALTVGSRPADEIRTEGARPS